MHIILYNYNSIGFPGGLFGKDSACNAGDIDLGQEDPPENKMVTQSSIFAWEIPWTEEYGGAMVHGVHRRVWHDLATKQQAIIYKII